MPIRSLNPTTGKILKEYQLMTNEELSVILGKAHAVYLKWRKQGLEGLNERLEKLAKVQVLLKERR